jgi:hypothetical protein
MPSQEETAHKEIGLKITSVEKEFAALKRRRTDLNKKYELIVAEGAVNSQHDGTEVNTVST